ncbi:MAG: DUF4402 domain-containing protein [Prolixibacteraceae bacterium]
MNKRDCIRQNRLNDQKIFRLFRLLLIPFYLIIFTLFTSNSISAQEKPPKPIALTIHNLVQLNFGAFVVTSSGSVTVTAAGARFGTGVVFLSAGRFPYSAASFDVDGIPGTVVHIIQNTSIGSISQGGHTMDMAFYDASPSKDFILVNPPMRVDVGVTLTVGTTAANPPGTYGGFFTVTMAQE